MPLYRCLVPAGSNIPADATVLNLVRVVGHAYSSMS